VLRGSHPGSDLGAGVDAELVQDAADVAVHGALGDEQPRPDLLVGQALGDQPRDVGLPASLASRAPSVAAAVTAARDVLASLALGILMDAFLVRTLLIPSTVVLLGRWNWWPSSHGRRIADAAPVAAEKPEFMPYGTPARR